MTDTAGDFLVDLAAKRLGGMVLVADDEFFAPKESLLEPLPPVFDPHAYTDRGKLMDGWETRRRRTPGHDWCIVRLGVPGVVHEVVVDTRFFRGNYPEAFALEASLDEGHPPPEELLADPERWTPLIPRTPLEGDAEQRFTVERPLLASHVRLSVFPDGGVARLRVLGEPLPDLRSLAGGEAALDVAATIHGGQAVGCSDRFFSSPQNLVAVGDARDMGDGWETRRRRGPGSDWAVVRLAAEAAVERVEIDTTNFKGNYPDRCSVELCREGSGMSAELGREGSGTSGADGGWRPLLSSERLAPHARHVFIVHDDAPATHVRLTIHPDGGVARLRVLGRVTDEGWLAWGVRRLDALSLERAVEDLLACCGSRAWARRMAEGRPYGTFAALTGAGDEVWEALQPNDWLEAFSAHPRIGDASGGAWSRGEQAGTASAGEDTLRALEEGNRRYETRFGHVFLICATGRGADEMLTALRERIGNDADTELRVAAEEQRKITRIRLEKLMRPEEPVRRPHMDGGHERVGTQAGEGRDRP